METDKKLAHTPILEELCGFLREAVDKASDDETRASATQALHTTDLASKLVALYGDATTRKVLKPLVRATAMDPLVAASVIAALVAALSKADQRITDLYGAVNNAVDETDAEAEKVNDAAEVSS